MKIFQKEIRMGKTVNNALGISDESEHEICKKVVAHYKILEMAKLAMEQSMKIMGVERGK